jgi:hypothetical protein
LPVCGSAFGEPLLEGVHRPRPQGAGSLLASLALEGHDGDWIETDIRDIQIDDLLNAGAGVVKQ